MRLLVVGLLFVVAGLCEIGGGYLDRCCVIGDGKGAEILCWHRTSTKRRYSTMDLDSFLVSLYVLVDDWRRRQWPADRPKPGRPTLLSASEVLTLAILAQWPRFRGERDFWRFTQAHLRSYFPRLVSQGQLNRRIRALEPELRALQGGLAGTLA